MKRRSSRASPFGPGCHHQGMTTKKLDPRDALVDRKAWADGDPVIELVEPDGRRTVLTRAQARVPAWQVRRWLRIGKLPRANGASAHVLEAFMSADAQMFYPEASVQEARAAQERERERLQAQAMQGAPA